MAVAERCRGRLKLPRAALSVTPAEAGGIHRRDRGQSQDALTRHVRLSLSFPIHFLEECRPLEVLLYGNGQLQGDSEKGVSGTLDEDKWVKAPKAHGILGFWDKAQEGDDARQSEA